MRGILCGLCVVLGLWGTSCESGSAKLSGDTATDNTSEDTGSLEDSSVANDTTPPGDTSTGTDTADKSDAPGDTTVEDTSIASDTRAEDTGSADTAVDTTPVDPCADRPPLEMTSGFSFLYGNSNPTERPFTGTTPWEDTFEMPFPKQSGIAKRLKLTRDHYAVIALDTFDVAATGGQIDTDNPQFNNYLTGSKLVSVSQCPGDFSAQPSPGCRRRLGPVSNLIWSFDTRPFGCQLERDKQYYLNIIFTDDEAPPIEWLCTVTPDSDECLMLINSTSG